MANQATNLSKNAGGDLVKSSICNRFWQVIAIIKQNILRVLAGNDISYILQIIFFI